MRRRRLSLSGVGGAGTVVLALEMLGPGCAAGQSTTGESGVFGHASAGSSDAGNTSDDASPLDSTSSPDSADASGGGVDSAGAIDGGGTIDEGGSGDDGGDGGSCSGICNGTCVNLQTDSNNCGSCGHACGGGTPSCSGGTCVSCTTIELPPSVNVDATQWATNFKTSPAWNCSAAGTTTIDSNAGTVSSTSCALGTLDLTNNVTQSGSGGPAVLVVRLGGLTVTNGHVLQLHGDKPVVFLIAGNVLVDLGGTIDASATPGPTGGTIPGPGGNSAACGSSTGGNGVPGTNGKGGGGGGFGTAGGRGGQNGGAGGVPSASTNLQPLRGGCGGGTADPGPGAGGGAFEISASGTITIGTGTNTASLVAAGGGSKGATNTNDTPSSGAGSGGGILLVSPAPATFGSNGVARVHGGGSGAGSNGSTAGENGHSADDTRAAGGTTTDGSGARGVTGGLCAQNSVTACGVASAAGANGNSGGGGGASGGGGGGGRVQIATGTGASVCE